MSEESFIGSEITFRAVQIKSLKIARKFARQLDKIEKTVGIQEVTFILRDSFVCPDIDISTLCKTPMERVLRDMIMMYRSNQGINEASLS